MFLLQSIHLSGKSITEKVCVRTGSKLKSKLLRFNCSSTTKEPASTLKPSSNVNFFDQASRDWDKAWKMQLTPWDLKGTVTPPLKQLFEDPHNQKLFSTKNKHALVPGCGSGYDCAYLSTLGYESVIGMDISPTAIEFATETIRKQSTGQTLPTNLKFEVADFFANHTVLNSRRYDFIFDYLFFAALDIPLRTKWAQSMTHLLKPQQGVLATLVFPLAPTTLTKEEKGKGPPYPVTLEDYEAVLSKEKWEIIHINKVMISRFYSFHLSYLKYLFTHS